LKESVNNIALSTGGVYTLLLFLSKEITLEIGKLGNQKFPRGCYTYTGSALGKGSNILKHRLSRHLKKEKRKFWHIDYLLANENVTVEAILVVETRKMMECEINAMIKSQNQALVQVKRFGATDCKNNCKTHLLHFPEVDKVDLLIQKIVSDVTKLVDLLSVHVFLKSFL
jgi:Uri superfamily endonuclease